MDGGGGGGGGGERGRARERGGREKGGGGASLSYLIARAYLAAAGRYRLCSSDHARGCVGDAGAGG